MNYYRKKSLKRMFLISFLALLMYQVSAQQTPPPCSYPDRGPSIGEVFREPLGDVVKPEQGSNMLTITRNMRSQRGAIWSREKLDFNKNFKLDSYIYLGNNLNNPADGITLTIQNDPRMESTPNNVIGGAGMYLSVYGNNTTGNGSYIRNAISLEFDTYVNKGSTDRIDYELRNMTNIGNGHVAFVFPKQNNNNRTGEHKSYIVSPVPLANNCWRKFRLTWIKDSQQLIYELEGVGTNYIVINPQEVFGASTAYWGFSSATGTNFTENRIAIVEIPQATETVLTKSAKNLTTNTPNADEASVGDIIEYTVTASYIEGWANWDNAIVKDILPTKGVEVDMSSIKLNGITTNGKLANNVLEVEIGSLGTNNQQQNPLNASITFNVLITNEVNENDLIRNSAQAWGEWREIVSNDVITKIIKRKEICSKPPLKTNSPLSVGAGITTLNYTDIEQFTSSKNGALVLESLTKGLIITNIEDLNNKISNPIEGMIVHDLDDNCLKLYNGQEWKCVKKYCIPE